MTVGHPSGSGRPIRKEEKIQVARALSEAGIDRIEAGMPAVSKEDAEAVKAIAHEGLASKVFAFARCAKSDVDLGLKADVDGLVMEVPSSDHIIKYAYGWPEKKAIDLSVEATAYAHEHGLYVTFFTIDSSRASFKACWKLINAVATRGHMDSLTVVDTFGVCSPPGFAQLVRAMKKRVKKPLEVHCHNDFGLAVANTEWGEKWPCMNPNLRVELEKLGVQITDRVPYVLHRSVLEGSKWVSPSSEYIVRETLYSFGQGLKVAVEVVLTAAARGYIEPYQDAIGVGGSGSGADSAAIMRATYPAMIFSKDSNKRLEIREVIAIPRKKKWYP